MVDSPTRRRRGRPKRRTRVGRPRDRRPRTNERHGHPWEVALLGALGIALIMLLDQPNGTWRAIGWVLVGLGVACGIWSVQHMLRWHWRGYREHSHG